MKYRRIVAFTIALILGAGCLAACSDKGGSEGDSGSDSVATDADTEVETQIDTVIDTETNDGTDTEADTESEPESESESESEAESESESETETESESETESEEEKREEELTPQLFKLTSDTQGVKVLGVRNLASENGLHMDWTCSGAEFGIDLKGGSIRLSFTVSDSCYFRIWVDGVEYKQNGSPYFTVLKSNPTINLTDIPVGRHTVKVMKVTGYTLAQAELTGVIFAGSMLTDAVDTSDKDLYIEFVGDSITCGWGTIGEHGGAYTDQDGTLAYPYLVAQALNADYSMTALSGQGLLCGDPGVTNGYLYADPRGNSDIQYDFARKADVVVINIGTNDYWNDGVSSSSFRTAYLNFLRTVREKNGDECKILCLYNTMNDTYANAILSAVKEFGGELEGVSIYKLNRADGNHHPNAQEHIAYFNVLKEIIPELPGKFIPDITVVPSGDGSKDSIDWKENS